VFEMPSLLVSVLFNGLCFCVLQELVVLESLSQGFSALACALLL
jgi:hypothetical protein